MVDSTEAKATVVEPRDQLAAEECQLAVGPFHQCCCNCRNHWQDFHHGTTAWDMREKHGGCVCSVPKGWVCVVFKLMDPDSGVHSGWPEHSVGCEMYSPLKARTPSAQVTKE